MPPLDRPYWDSRRSWEYPCHYGDRWMDAYATWIRRLAVNRIWPSDAQTVLDVGCGDGRFALWLSRRFGVVVDGTDPIKYRGVERRVRAMYCRDAESWEPSGLTYDVATFVTSLVFMTDWQRGVERVGRSARRLAVIENVQTPTPPWQMHRPEKQPISYPELIAGMAQLGWEIERSVCVNVVDRRWMQTRSAMTPLVAAATLVGDAILSRVAPPEDGRYAAVMLRRRG